MARQAFGNRGDRAPMTLQEAIDLVRGVHAMQRPQTMRAAKPTHGTAVTIRRRSDGRKRAQATQRTWVPETTIYVADLDALEAPPRPYWWPGVA